jgi:hypothetical protein
MISAPYSRLDVKPLLDLLHQHHIYAIARIVVFEDPVLAEARPDWTIHDSASGDLSRTWNRLAWVNAHRPEIWDYDIALAREAADLGFDEIQLDYIRFPSDGPLDRAEYGVPHDAETRPAAIRTFLTMAHDALLLTGAYLSADVFGLTMWSEGDAGIGQRLEVVIDAVDFVCPMIYSSHFLAGSLGFDIPNDHPYDVILLSVQNGAQRIPHDAAKIRPWLQDFTLGEGIPYGDIEVQKQIQASDEAGTSGWMLWNAANAYHTRVEPVMRSGDERPDGSRPSRTILRTRPPLLANESGISKPLVWPLLQALRPKQWTKNAVVFAALLFDGQ